MILYYSIISVLDNLILLDSWIIIKTIKSQSYNPIQLDLPPTLCITEDPNEVSIHHSYHTFCESVNLQKWISIVESGGK
jgi:hypothetical protein